MKSRRVILALALAASGLALASSPPVLAAPSVTLVVNGFVAQQGFLMIALHDETGWSGAPLARLRVPVSGTSMTVSLPAPAPGRYGIRMYHDVDGDGRMATNFVGFPTEPFGFSNDAKIFLGPPEFASVAFEVGPEGASQQITVK